MEGGFVVAKDPSVAEKVEWMRRYGHKGFEDYHGVGINGKLSEVHAAMGLAQFPHLSKVIQRRREIASAYRSAIESMNGLEPVPLRDLESANHAYFPVLVGEDYPLSCDELYDQLRANGINSRRYFYPLLSNFGMDRGPRSGMPSELPVALDAAARVICLPIYPALNDADQTRVIECLQT